MDTDTDQQMIPLPPPTMTVADALSASAYLSAIEDWASTRRSAVRDWIKVRAELRKAQDGGAPTWRFDDGTVLLTDPKPSARIADQEAFARWMVETVLDEDPDAEPDATAVQFGDPPKVTRRRRAEVDETALLAFTDRMRDPNPIHGPNATTAADQLARHVKVYDEWLIGEAALTDLLDAKRIKLAASGAVVDVETGEQVPGAVYVPAGKAQVQVRPSPDAKAAAAAQLSARIGPPTLPGE